MAVAEGPAPSNTGPLNSSVEILASGWDSLYLSFGGALQIGAAEYLAALKTAATEKGDGEPVDLGGIKGIVQPHGRSHYPYLVRCPGFDLQVTSSTRLPTIYCQLRSEFLHADGVEPASATAARVTSRELV